MKLWILTCVQIIYYLYWEGTVTSPDLPYTPKERNLTQRCPAKGTVCNPFCTRRTWTGQEKEGTTQSELSHQGLSRDNGAVTSVPRYPFSFLVYTDFKRRTFPRGGNGRPQNTDWLSPGGLNSLPPPSSKLLDPLLLLSGLRFKFDIYVTPWEPKTLFLPRGTWLPSKKREDQDYYMKF